MKIVSLLGSPRLKGNSAALAECFLETAKGLGAATQSFVLNRLNYQGCQACRACKKSSEICVLKDDLAAVLDAVRQADIIVFASPVYFGDVTGQMKTFIDRTYSYLTPDFHHNPDNTSRLLPGKTAVWILTQGMPKAAFADVFPRYEWVMNIIGIQKVHLIRGCGLAKPDDIRNHPELLKEAGELARSVMSGSGA